MASGIRSRPNVLRCRMEGCRHTVDFPFTGQPNGAGLTCEACGGLATVRCGSGERAARDHPCYRVSKPGVRCRMHGGKAVKGPDHPNYDHGKEGRYIPARYMEDFERGIGDPMAQRAMTVQLALMEGIQTEVLKRLGTTESGEAWAAVGALAQGIKDSLAAIRSAGPTDPERAGALARQLMLRLESDLIPAVENGVGEEAAREELQQVFLRRARLIRVQQQGEKSVPIVVLSVLQTQFVAMMTKYISDRRTLTQLIAEIREIGMPGWTEANLKPKTDEGSQEAN